MVAEATVDRSSQVTLEPLVASGVFEAAIVRRDIVSDEVIELILAAIDDVGIGTQLAVWRQEDRAGRGSGGRPGSINDRALLTVLVVLGLEGSPLLVSRAADVFEYRLSPHARSRLGISDDQPANWYQRSWRAIHSLLAVVDPYPGPRRYRLTPEQYIVHIQSRDPDYVANQRDRIDWLMNQLLEATLRIGNRAMRRWRGSVCVDATPIQAFGKKGTARWRKRLPKDPQAWKPEMFRRIASEYDAGWYIREDDHKEPDEPTKKPRKKMWAYEATLTTAAPDDPSVVSEYPFLVAAIGFDKPGHNISDLARMGAASIVERGHPVGLYTGDLAYLPNADAEKLQLPVRALGYKIASDYRIDQLGVKESYAGAILVEGAWYCPSMPQPLIDASIDFANKTIDEATYRARIGQREKYQLRAKSRPDEAGYQPLMCPAVGPQATVDCPLKPATTVNIRRVRIRSTPPMPDRICTNKTSVTFPPEVGAKYRQDLPYEGADWNAFYRTARNTIENANSHLKDDAHTASASPGRRRIRGYAAQYLLVTIAVVASNLRKLWTFVADQQAAEAVANGTRTKKPRRRRRESHLGEHLPLLRRIHGTSPPVTAA